MLIILRFLTLLPFVDDSFSLMRHPNRLLRRHRWSTTTAYQVCLYIFVLVHLMSVFSLILGTSNWVAKLVLLVKPILRIKTRSKQLNRRSLLFKIATIGHVVCL